ncbi:MAG: hypothetical protein SOZ47_07345 [Lawsonibacter sp.]|nr:hypothetical protein [Lawsonibacter sp.]
MQEFLVDTSEWYSFWRDWEQKIKQIPGMKEAMLERAGSAVRLDVQRAIDRSGVNDRTGRVKLWQNRHIGDKLGYVAVRADSVEVMSGGGNRKPLNAGALTNYLTSGHKVRGPSGRNKRYRPRATMTRVPGFSFYKTASYGAEKIALEAAKQFLDQLEVELKL